MKQDPELLHLRVSQADVGFWETLCGLSIGAVEHWCFPEFMNQDPWGHLQVCSICDDWSNLQILAEAEL